MNPRYRPQNTGECARVFTIGFVWLAGSLYLQNTQYATVIMQNKAVGLQENTMIT